MQTKIKTFYQFDVASNLDFTMKRLENEVNAFCEGKEVVNVSSSHQESVDGEAISIFATVAYKE